MEYVPGKDLTGHFVVFGLLNVAVCTGLADLRFRGKPLGVARITVATVAFVCVEEWSQNFLPTRNFSWDDLIASAAGALIAALVLARR